MIVFEIYYIILCDYNITAHEGFVKDFPVIYKGVCRLRRAHPCDRQYSVREENRL